MAGVLAATLHVGGVHRRSRGALFCCGNLPAYISTDISIDILLYLIKITLKIKIWQQSTKTH